MPCWLRFFRGCIRPDAKQFTLGTGKDVSLQDRGLGDVESLEPGLCRLGERNDILPKDIDQPNGAISSGLVETNVRELPKGSIVRRRSSSNADTLAPLAEDETLSPLDQGFLDDSNRNLWTEASRSSCPTLAAQGCVSAVGLEKTAGLAQPVTRPQSLLALSKNGSYVSPVSAATSRSLASPMRHDFMTLMRQASNRASSCGVTAEPVGQVSPQAWSLGLAPDGCRGPGAVGSGARATDWAAARQIHGGDTLPHHMRSHRRQRRTSAFVCPSYECGINVGSGGMEAGNPLGNIAAGGRPVCPLTAGNVVATFTRCSSSPDMMPDGMLVGTACTGRDPGVPMKAPLVPSPCTAPPSIGHEASSGGSCQSCDGGGGGGGGGSLSASGGSGGGGCVPPPVMFRTFQSGAGRYGLEFRPVPGPSPSPLRPRDLPPPVTALNGSQTTTAFAAAAAITVASVACTHSASALPKYNCPARGNFMSKCPDSGENSLGSYQHMRLLQQLKEQHDLYHRQRTTPTAVVNVAAVAVATEAAPMIGAPSSSSAGKMLQARPGISGRGNATEAIKWVEAYFMTKPGSTANACPDNVAITREGLTMEPLPLPGERGNEAGAHRDAATSGAVSSVVSTGETAAIAEGCDKLNKPLAILVEGSNALLPDTPTGDLPSISTFLAPTLGSNWIDHNCCCTDVRAAGSGVNVNWCVSGSNTSQLRAADGEQQARVRLNEPTVGPAVELRTNADRGRGMNSSVNPLPEAIIVGSLGETCSFATKEVGSARGASSLALEAVEKAAADEAELEAVTVMQNLLQRNVLPDNAERDADLDEAVTGGGPGQPIAPVACRRIATPPVFEAFQSYRDPHGKGGSSDNPSVSSPLLLAQCAPERRSSAWVRKSATSSGPLPVQIPGLVIAGSLSYGGFKEAEPTTSGLAIPCGDCCSQRVASGSLAADGTAAVVTPGPLLTSLSHTTSPEPDSLVICSLASRTGTSVLISPLPSGQAVPGDASGMGSSAAAVAVVAASLLPGPATDAATNQTPSMCSPSPSHIMASPTFMDTPSPSDSTRGDGPSNRSAVFGVDGSPFESEIAAAASTCGGVAPDRVSWVATFASGGAGAICGGGVGGAGASGIMNNRSSISTCRVSSVFASESSLAAIALLRSAASNCPLPDDGANIGTGSGGGSSHFAAIQTAGCGGDATAAGGRTLVGLDTDGPSTAAMAAGSSSLRSVTASTVDPGSTAETARCLPLASLYSTVAWPSPPTLQQPSLLSAKRRSSSTSSRSPRMQQSLLPSQTVAQHADMGSTHSLRLEDGLVPDPLLLIDGLGQLSYVTSGSYAAVYRGTLEDVPVGIKFLASTSLDLNAPAVKEALLGPGLEHENIIRTFTTRVARVDGKAVAQLKAVAAAMAAAVALRRKRNSAGARRFSSGTPATGASLSVPSTPVPTLSAATGMGAASRRTVGMPQSPVSASVACNAVLACASPSANSRSSPPRTLPAAVTTGSANLASGTDRLQLPVQASTARLVVNSSRRLVTVPAPCNASFPAAESSRQSAGGNVVGSETKSKLVSSSGALLDRSLAAQTAITSSGVAVDEVPPTRQMYIRKSASANARADTSGCGASAESDEAFSEGLETQPPLPLVSPPPLQLLLSPQYAAGTSSSSGGNLAVHFPSPRGSGHVLTEGVNPLLPVLPHLAPTSQLPQVPPSASARYNISTTAHRNGSAAQRMLHVLRTLRVVGPTGQPTAEAHYVTAVVMEFADAGNLDSFSRMVSPCDLVTAVELLHQVARGMSYLHAHGLVHGDLKPANVLLLRNTSSGKLIAKVADFGLSGVSGQLGTHGGADTCGTVAYSAPERLAEEEGVAEQAADVYSFGICMQQLVSGVRPFAELTFGQIMFSVLCLNTRPAWPEGRCGALEPLYDMCCDSQPSKRPTFDQVVAWLDSLWPAVD